MNFASNLGRATLGLLCLTALVACGDDGITCPGGMVLEGDECNIPDDGGPMEGDSGPMVESDAFLPPDEGPPCTPDTDPDLPDGDFEDTDCDGFDGDLDAAVAVVPSGASAPDGVAAFESTIADAIDTAESEGLTQVWVGVGTWTGVVQLVGGISVYGGYDQDDGWQRTRGDVSRVVGPGPLLMGENIDATTVVALLQFEADDAPDEESSVAGWLESSSEVVLEEVRLESGRGGDGIDRTRPARAGMGQMGDPGGMTGVGTQCPTTFRPRTTGGDGGDACSGCHDGGRGGTTSGSDSSTGTPSDGSAGGDGSTMMLGGSRVCALSGTPDNGGGAPGDDGTVGQTGGPGDDGNGAPAGVFTMAGYVPGEGTNGAAGGAGQGGGGGASASDVSRTGNDFCIYFGASGGGGGGGGCGGEGGPAGSGGGASIALWLWNTTVELVDVTLASQNGGDGGRGALGGEGGVGGPGGEGGAAGSGLQYEGAAGSIEPGGDGGDGGDGGQGGGGGGGAGGPSIGVVLGGDSSETLGSTGITFELGSGGAAGLGAGSDNDGAAGAMIERFDPEG